MKVLTSLILASLISGCSTNIHPRPASVLSTFKMAAIEQENDEPSYLIHLTLYANDGKVVREVTCMNDALKMSPDQHWVAYNGKTKFLWVGDFSAETAGSR